MVQVSFPLGSRSLTVYGLTQYDYGQELEVHGLPLPAVVECQISLQRVGGTTESLAGVVVDDTLTLAIPDTYLAQDTESDYTIYVYIYVTTESSGTTVYLVSLPVTARSMPDGYVPGETSPFAAVIEEITELVEEAQGAATLSESYAKGGTGTRTGEDTDNSKYYSEEARDAETGAADSAAEARASEVAAAGSASTAAAASTSAAAAKTAAEAAMVTATAKATEAANSASAAGVSAAAASASETAAGAYASTAGASAVSAASSASAAESSATSAASSASSAGASAAAAAAALGEVATAKQDALTAISGAQTTAVGAVAADGTTQVAAVTAEGTAQKAAVQAKGAEVIASIPSDYSTLRNDVSSLKSDFGEFEYNVLNEWELSGIGDTANKFWNVESSVAVLDTASNWRAINPYNVKEGEIFEVTAVQGNTDKTRIWVIVDDEMNIIAMDENHNPDDNQKHTSRFMVPSGGTKLLVTYRSTSAIPTPRITIKKLLYSIPVDHGTLEELGITSLMDCNQYGYYRTGAAYTANITDLPVGYSAGVDAANIYVEYPCYASYAWCRQRIVTTNGKAWWRIIQYSTSAQSWTINRDWVSETLPLAGKKVSVMGDSISSYSGYVPTGYQYYYPKHGVTNVNQMWWNVLCAETGMELCVINAFSGSGVTQLEEAQHTDRIPMSSDERCSNLGSGENMPDIIIIAGGTNDFTYSESAQSEPIAWEGKTAPVISNNFTEAYACMIKKIQTNYPNAIIVCLSTLYTERGNDNGYTWTHTSGNNVYTQEDYDRAIESVAQKMRVPYICVNDIGFNRNNYYPTYCQDDQTTPTHPNAAGHAVMGKAIAVKLMDAVKGFM